MRGEPRVVVEGMASIMDGDSFEILQVTGVGEISVATFGEIPAATFGEIPVATFGEIPVVIIVATIKHTVHTKVKVERTVLEDEMDMEFKDSNQLKGGWQLLVISMKIKL